MHSVSLIMHSSSCPLRQWGVLHKYIGNEYFLSFSILLFLFFPLSFTYHSLQCPPVSFFVALFFLPRILAFFPALWGFYSQVYDHFLTNAHIYAHKKAHIYSLQTSMRIWGHRKSSYKRHRIIPSAKKSFMYDGAEK